MTRTYKIIDYDVWGNNKDGYEVNAAHYTGCEVTFDDSATNRQIVTALKACGYLRKGLHWRSLKIDGELAGETNFTLYVNDIRVRSGGLKPAFEMRAIEPEVEL